jgi:hypothetical protein
LTVRLTNRTPSNSKVKLLDLSPGEQIFTLVGSEGAVTLVPAYLKSFPVAGVAMVPLSDSKATRDFLVVWQRGRTAKSVRALLDALAVSANSFEPRMDANRHE